jgi:hypothetical protein
MKLHTSSVEKLLFLCQNYGGHAEEVKLIGFISDMCFSPYVRTQSDSIVLVETIELLKERQNRNLPTTDLIPIKFHASVVKKIMELYDMYGGHENEYKLRTSFNQLDFTPYERKVEFKDTVLVLTEDYIKILRGTSRK